MNQKFEVVVFNEDFIGQVIGIYDMYEQAEEMALLQSKEKCGRWIVRIQEVFIKND